MNFKVSAAIYDLDGTLLNSGKEGYRRLLALGEQFGIEITPETEKRIRETWGLDPENLIVQGFNISLPLAREIHAAWIVWDDHEPIPLVSGVPEMLQKNVDNGILNFVFTSRKTESAKSVLKKFSIDHLFEDVVGTDGGTFVPRSKFKKPNSRALNNLLHFINKHHHIPQNEVIYVGDEIFDIKCGMGAGLQTFGVISGLKTTEELLAAGATSNMIFPDVAHIIF